MRLKGQRESNFCSEIISNKYAQRDASNAPFKKLCVTTLGRRMRAEACGPEWRNEIFHPPGLPFNLSEEIRSLILLLMST